MELNSTFAILSLAFGLGIMHALDADHIMAVTGLSSARANWKSTLSFCLRWALGHGSILFIIGAAVFLFGMAIPERLSHYAEIMVAIALIFIGCYVIWDLFKRRAHLHFHRHDELPEHAHWHTHQHRNQTRHAEDKHIHHHGAVMVGILHGTAGSAPLLVLIPIAQMQSAWLGLTYIVLFGLGVIVSMLVFGGVLSKAFKWLNSYGNQFVRATRLTIASSAIGLGVYLLQAQI